MNEPRYMQLRNFDVALSADIVKKSKGNPPWIKSWCGQLEDPEYLSLTWAQRGFLHDLRLIAARRGNKILWDVEYLNRRCKGQKGVRTRAVMDLLEKRRFVEPFHLETNSAANALVRSRDVLESLAIEERAEERRGENPPSPLTRKTVLSCHVCALTFKTQRRLTEHLANVHDVVPADDAA